MATPPTLPLPVEDLTKFLTDLESLLAEVVANPRGLLPDEFVDALEPAWRNVQPLFGEVRNEISSIDPAALEAAGLTGPELGLKISVASWGFGSVRDAIRNAAPHAAAALATALGLADVILKSLPLHGLTERIEEFKSVVEKGAEAVAFVQGP